jgi:transposase-like protein
MAPTPPRRSTAAEAKTKTALSLRAFHALFPDEDAARLWFEQARWPEGPVCPKCGSVGRSVFQPRVRTHRCLACPHQFTVKAGTPMHRSHLPLLVWAQAIYLMVSSSKGISSVKLSEMLDIDYKTAWFLTQRIRLMMAADVERGADKADGTPASGRSVAKRLPTHSRAAPVLDRMRRLVVGSAGLRLTFRDLVGPSKAPYGGAGAMV